MREVAPGIYEIDTEAFGQSGLISSYFINGSDKKVLIDPGFPSSVATIESRLKEGGFDIAELDYVLLTHFHIDHSGGTGGILEKAPKAKVICQKRGAFYVKNFGKIVGGAKMVFGAEFSKKFSDAKFVDADRVMPVDDGDIIDLGGSTKLRVIYTPGHTSDHVCYLEEGTGTLFSGDLACLQYPMLNSVLIPAGSPPIFDLAVQSSSLKTLAKYSVEQVAVPHFGLADKDIKNFIEANDRAVMSTRDDIVNMFKEGIEFHQMVERMRVNLFKTAGVDESSLSEFFRSTWLVYMLKTGLMGYMAYLLQYAPYPRSYVEDTEKHLNKPMEALK